MQHPRKIEWILLILLSLAVYACNQGEPGQITNAAPPAGDTLQPYITAAEDARQKSILLIPYTENGLWGFADTTGTIRIEPIYKRVESFGASNLTRVQAKDDRCGLIDKTGKIVEPMIHKGIYVCGNDVFGFQKDDHIELKNRDNRRIDHGEVIGVSENGKEGLNAVRTQHGVGFMDTDGNMVIDDTYEHVNYFAHGVVCVANDLREWKVINKEGKQVSDLTFLEIYPFDNGYGVGHLACDYRGEQWGVIDTLGNVIIPFRYHYIAGTFGDAYIACPTNRDWDHPSKTHFEILNRQGKKITETRINIFDNFSEGLATATKGERYGYVDTLAHVVIPFEYEWACPFRNGLAWVEKNGRHGFINKQGKVVIPIQYESAFDYVYMDFDGAIVVDPKTQERFFIDKTGREYRDFSR